MISRDCCVQNTEEFGSDISRDTGIPRGIEPKGSPAPAPALLVTRVSLIQRVDVNLLVLEFMSVTAGFEGILIQGLGLVKNSFIAGKHVQTIFNILRNIFLVCRGLV